MVSSVIVLILSALCGVAFGYAAQRGSLCVISGIENVLEGRSPRIFLSFLRCSVWVLAVSLPLAWLMTGNQLDTIASPSLAAVFGGALFGIGAAINGGCSFGTIIRLGSGDMSFLATLAGLGFGFIVYQAAPVVRFGIPEIGASQLERPSMWGAIALAAAVLFCLRELVKDRRRGHRDGRWPPERSAILMGVAGGVLYALHGSWAYTIAIDRGLKSMAEGGIANLQLVLVFVACVLGASIGAQRLHRLRLRLNARDIPKHLLGGTVMGVGAALIPGGNDALVLHALPALSLHAPFAYAALVLGASSALALSARLRR
jgi:uncharacterized membrane protein YedE/YeeE